MSAGDLSAGELSVGELSVGEPRASRALPVRRWMALAAVLSTFVLAHAALAQQPLAAARQQAEAALGAAASAEQAAEAVARHPDFAAATQDPAFAQQLAEARRFLGWARSAWERAEREPSPSAYRDAGVLLARAEQELEAYRGAVEGSIAAIERARRPPPPPPLPPDTSPPRKLEAIVAVFLAGEHAAVIDQVDAALGASGTRFEGVRGERARKSIAHARLLRAASRYALYLASGERADDAALRGAAVDDVLAVRERLPELEPPPEVFSPRFCDFFAATR